MATNKKPKLAEDAVTKVRPQWHLSFSQEQKRNSRARCLGGHCQAKVGQLNMFKVQQG